MAQGNPTTSTDDTHHLDDFTRRLLHTRDRLLVDLPEIDPDDLFLILNCMLRPIGTGRRFFIRRQEDGTHVF